MIKLSIQVMDTSRGCHADGLPVALERRGPHTWEHVDGAETDEHGRIDALAQELTLEEGTYRLTFDTGTYFAANDLRSVFPVVRVVLEITEPNKTYYVALALSAYGYSISCG